MNNIFGRKKISEYYALDGHNKIKGWISAHTLSFLYYLCQFQERNAIKGNVAEIGVFQGRFFIALCLMLQHKEKAIAIDVFEDQDLNADHSGAGDYNIFVENIKNILGNRDHIHIIKEDSLKVTSKLLLQTGGQKIRLFSIDGCHTITHTENDLRLASEAIVPGGVIMLDDFENKEWPGVRQGADQFLYKNKKLQPFAVAYNKLYLTNIDYAPKYQKFMEEKNSLSTDKLSYEKISECYVPRILMPAVENIFADDFDQIITFSSTGSSPEKYLINGWSFLEPWGVWSQEENASLKIPLGATDRDLTMITTCHAFVVEEQPELKVDIYIHGKYVDSVLFKTGKDYHNWHYHISKDDITPDSELEISFRMISQKSPYELGISPDKRKLGIGLRSIRFMKM